MALNVVLVGDHLQDSIDIPLKKEGVFMKTQKEVKDCSYIDKYKKCLNSLVPSKLISHDNNCFTTYTDIKNNHYFVIPKTNHISKHYQRSMPGTNVLVYFVNMNEQKNYAWKQLQQWNTSLNMTKFEIPPSNPHHIHKSYQLFQRMMLGLPHFIYPPKYLCIVFCGAENRTHFTDRKKFIMDVYSQIIYEKCQWHKTKTLLIADPAFNDGSIPSHALHVKLMDMVQKSISENSPGIISKNEDEKQQAPQNLIASIFHNIITETKSDEYVELIMFCSILHGSMKKNDTLMLHPANIEVNILDMKCNAGNPLAHAQKGIKMSVKLRINYLLWQKLKKLRKRKHFLLSKDCIESFKWNHIHAESYKAGRTYYHSDDGIEMKLYLASRNNFQRGIYRNTEFLVLYLGHTYPMKVTNFGDAQPSIDTIFEWKVLYDMVKKLWNITLSTDCIRNIYYFIYTSEEHNRKIGLLQHTKSININVDPINPITFSLVKPFNKFCVLARNEVVAKGKFIGISKLKADVNLDGSIFNLTDSEKRYILFKWMSNIRSYSKMQLIHRGSRDGFDTASFNKNCNNKPATLCIIQSTESGEIFGGYHQMPICGNRRSTSYGWGAKKTYDNQAFIFMLRMNSNDLNLKPFMLRFGYQQRVYPWMNPVIGIRFGRGCYLGNQCHQSVSYWTPNQSEFQHPRNDMTTLKKCKFPNSFITKDYEIWQMIQ